MMFGKYSDPDAAKDVFKAVQDDDLTNLRFFLSDGADIDLRNEQGHTLLHVAILENRLQVARLLLDAGADADMHGGSAGYTPLHFTAYKKNSEMTLMLLEYTEQLERTDHQNMTPLQLAAFMGCKDVVAALAQAGADYNRTDVSGHTPANIAQQRAGENWGDPGSQPFIETSTYLFNLQQNGLPENARSAPPPIVPVYKPEQFERDMEALQKFNPDPARFRLPGQNKPGPKPPQP